MDDLTQAWLCAINCDLFAQAPGPKLLNIASDIEPHMVSRTEAFRDLYARILLVDLGGDLVRCDVLCRRIEKARRRPPSAQAAAAWSVAAELAGRARELITQTGADRSAAARRRMLAGARHLTQSVILGQWVPDYQRELDGELAAALADTYTESGDQ